MDKRLAKEDAAWSRQYIKATKEAEKAALKASKEAEKERQQALKASQPSAPERRRVYGKEEEDSVAFQCGLVNSVMVFQMDITD